MLKLRRQRQRKEVMMSSTTVRINTANHELLKKLSKVTDMSMQNVIEKALKQFQKQLFWDKAAKEYLQLRQDEKAWMDEQAENALWDTTLSDGLDEDSTE